MRPRGSITGPLILITLGAIFLVHSIRPEFPLGAWLSSYWPYLLIAWGVIQLIEVTVRYGTGRPVPVNGISGGAWVVVILICVAGAIAFQAHRPGTWWRHINFERGVEAFGEAHDYQLPMLQKPASANARLVLENFRGAAKIVGTDANDVSISGHKVIHAFSTEDAERANKQTPVEMTVSGDTVTVRCNQDRAGTRVPVSTDLTISVPKHATIEATGTYGDFDITSVRAVDVASDNAGVRLQDIDGNVKVDTHRSDVVRCTNVKGNVDLSGHGADVELSRIQGQVTVRGNFTGSVMLRELAKPARIENMRTELDVEQIPGEVRLERGIVNLQNVIGPVRLSTRSNDVTLDGVSNGVDVTVDRGDVDLRPGHLPLGRIVVHTRSGNIEVALPQSALFAITASTDHGEIENEFGDALRQHTAGRGARLEGSIGSGPNLNLTTERGTITIRKATAEEPAKASGLRDNSSKPANAIAAIVR